MQAQIQKLPKSKLEIKIEVLRKEFDDFYQKAIFDLGSDLEIPGFRKGKAPKEIIEKAISKETILKEATEKAIKESYLKAVLENKIEALGQPEVEILKFVSGSSLKFKAIVSVMPEVKLPDYKLIASKVKRNEIEVQNQEVEDSLKQIQKSRAKFTLKSGAAQKGDWVEIEVAEPDKIKDSFILGEGHFVPGFEENLIGMESGQEKEFSLTSEEKNPSVEAKLLQFQVKMISVQKMKLPEINDQFAKDLGEFENLNALKQVLFNRIKSEKERDEIQKVRSEILEKIAGESELEIPEILIEEQKKIYLENMKKEVLRIFKISFEDYLKKTNKSEGEMLESFQESAQKQIRNSLVLKEIQKEEKVEVSDQEVEKFLSQHSQEEKDLRNLKNYAKELIREEKTFQLLKQF